MEKSDQGGKTAAFRFSLRIREKPEEPGRKENCVSLTLLSKGLHTGYQPDCPVNPSRRAARTGMP
jgi:hypothetical protein